MRQHRKEAPRRAAGHLDLSLAPTPAEGDSVAEILEAIGVRPVRRPRHHGRARHAPNDAVKGVMASSSVGGLSRVHPRVEDAGMIRAAEDGALSLGWKP